MQNIDHIGIAVKDLDAAIPLYARLLATPCYKTETVAGEQVETAFFKKGETKIELLQGQTPESVISRFVGKKGEGLHHIAFEVADIHAEMKRLAAEGFTLLSDAPKEGADNKLICFLHPRDTSGVLIELCMERPTGESTSMREQ
ncbi:MAG TPA: methylmalonyl-CoA epimerase [Puia sp.]|jgi:methylmalonyl-CoA/ethylmalonyl-CoA epimerase|nr:methylmalonyl-CoA epimerase [Puia sp.]